VRVVVNGKTAVTEPIGELPARFQVPLTLPQASSYVLVIAESDSPLPPLAGTRALPIRSTAFTNPIWVVPP